MDHILDSLIKTDYNKEMKKVSIFERCIDLSNINKKTNECIHCNKNANYICLIDNNYYCWYHTITWKDK
jgi:hypothetical protein